MLKVGDYVALKTDLVLGKKYGTVTFGKYHVPYLRKLLRVYKVSSTATVYCHCGGYPCECGTFSEPMLNVAKFNIGDTVKITYNTEGKQYSYLGTVTTITSIKYIEGVFVYQLNCDGGFYTWREYALEHVKDDLEDLKPVLENENQLQRKDSNLRSGERIKGSRVHGRFSKASIRSRPLRDPKSIRGK